MEILAVAHPASISHLSARRGRWLWLLPASLASGCLGGPQIDPGTVARGEVRTSSYHVGLTTEADRNRADAGIEDASAEPDAAAQADAAPPQPEPPPPPGTGDVPPPNASDDSAHCGDGFLDDNELCDVGIKLGQPGACPSGCNNDDPCHPQKLMVQTCWSRCVPVMPQPGSMCP